MSNNTTTNNTTTNNTNNKTIKKIIKIFSILKKEDFKYDNFLQYFYNNFLNHNKMIIIEKKKYNQYMEMKLSKKYKTNTNNSLFNDLHKEFCKTPYIEKKELTTYEYFLLSLLDSKDVILNELHNSLFNKIDKKIITKKQILKSISNSIQQSLIKNEPLEDEYSLYFEMQESMKTEMDELGIVLNKVINYDMIRKEEIRNIYSDTEIKCKKMMAEYQLKSKLYNAKIYKIIKNELGDDIICYDNSNDSNSNDSNSNDSNDNSNDSNNSNNSNDSNSNDSNNNSNNNNNNNNRTQKFILSKLNNNVNQASKPNHSSQLNQLNHSSQLNQANHSNQSNQVDKPDKINIKIYNDNYINFSASNCIYILAGSRFKSGGMSDQGIETNETNLYLSSTIMMNDDQTINYYPLSDDIFIYYPKVLIFKNYNDKNYSILDKNDAKIISILNSSPSNNIEELEDKLINTFKLCSYLNYDCIIFDEWYMQDFNISSNIFKNVIKNYGKLFKQIIFGIKNKDIYNIYNNNILNDKGKNT